MKELEVIPVSWEVRRPEANEEERMLIDLRIVDRGKGSYAVTRGSHQTLNKKGQWEWERQPSSRSAAYKRRCRWDDFAEAEAAARRAYDGLRATYAYYLDKENR